ncbi:MAG TPA: CDP-alcohol phosphatidyltransferase family protein [Gammaproteobacteria bacterium]|nr:CDP-alcohol phosphatidyltransferase family protein [Gammaproteobacteria bacterium]
MSHDTWIHRAVRVLVRPLAGTPVTPNHLTSARLLTGIGAAAAFAVGEASWTRAGVVLFVLSMLFDRADGELARLSGKGSRFGHFYDIVTDAVCDTAVLAGIGIGLSAGTWGKLAIVMGLFAGLSVAFIFYLIMTIERDLGAGGGAFGALAGFDPDDAMVLIPIAMWLGYGETLLLAAVVLAPLAAIIVAVGFRRRRSAHAADGGKKLRR